MPHSALRSRTPGRAPNRLRIIGGRWRGSRVEFPPLPSIRPSPDRVRETLFNWLQPHILGARCLDLFAGSGALGLEALSRGAAHVTFVDREPQIARHLERTLERFGSRDGSVMAVDAARFLAGVPQRFDIVFLDPPFAEDALQQTLGALARGWLAPGAFVYVECPAERTLEGLEQGWSVHRTGRAGQVGYHLLRSRETEGEVPA